MALTAMSAWASAKVSTSRGTSRVKCTHVVSEILCRCLSAEVTNEGIRMTVSDDSHNLESQRAGSRDFVSDHAVNMAPLRRGIQHQMRRLADGNC
jgi:hypothetical protein